jgi:hypothetical protein
MDARLNALRKAALEAGEQLGQRGSRIIEESPTDNLNMSVCALGIISGFALGIVTGLLIAPTSGYETRARLGNRASDALLNVKEMAKKREEKISEHTEGVA